MQTRQKLYLPSTIQVREIEGQKQFFGRAVVYGQWSDLIHGYFREQILPGAFAEHLATSPDVVACIDHDIRKLLGRTTSGTLKLTDGPDGLDVVVSQPDTSYARDLASSVSRGDIRGMSFVFDIDTDDWRQVEGVKCRDVLKGKLYEVSFVAMPAYPQTSAGMRSIGMTVEQAADLARRSCSLENLKRKIALLEKE